MRMERQRPERQADRRDHLDLDLRRARRARSVCRSTNTPKVGLGAVREQGRRGQHAQHRARHSRAGVKRRAIKARFIAARASDASRRLAFAQPSAKKPAMHKISRPAAAPRARRRLVPLAACATLGGEPDQGRHPLCRPRRQHALQCRLGPAAAAAIIRRPPLIFDEVERQHPYSIWARRAQLMSAFSYYAGARPYQVDRIGAPLPLDPPRQPRRALCALSDRAQLLRADQRRHPRPERSPARRSTRWASSSAAIPTRAYAADARLKIDLVRDHLAGKEMEIGRFYQRRGQWLAAVDPLPHRGRRISDHQPRARSADAADRILSRARHPRGGAQRRRGARRQLSRAPTGIERAYELVQKHAPAAPPA